ncbi:MAG: hypothetical protein ONA69_10120 [candidate division KSB1 bacterium]|nr:hypothetical protein [candidate division KSB1 bacterium]
MRNKWIAGWLFCLTPAIGAQESERTLLTPPVHQGIYAAPTFKFGPFGPRSESSLIAGVQGGWIIDRKYVLGLGAFGLSSRVKAPDDPRVEGLLANFSYVGLFGSYIWQSYKLLHAEATVLGGAGEMFYRSNEYRLDRTKSDAFGLFELGLNGILNLTPGVRIGAGMAHRWVQRINSIGMTNRKAGGTAFTLLLQIGRF